MPPYGPIMMANQSKSSHFFLPCNFQCLYLVHILVDLGPSTLDEWHVHRTLDEVQLSNSMKMDVNCEPYIFSQYIVVSKRPSKTKCLLLIGQP
jgi:hypothetical protein